MQYVLIVTNVVSAVTVRCATVMINPVLIPLVII